jgi:outer membrane protein OmpA-like peptidoglycan-associated protein/uncharacterized small protein (DUF1192 family)
MKQMRLSASLLALTLIAAPALAPVVMVSPAIAEDAAVPADVATLLADKRDLASLSVDELHERIKLLRGFLKNNSLPKDTVKQLHQMEKDAKNELHSRQGNNQASGSSSDNGGSAVESSQAGSSTNNAADGGQTKKQKNASQPDNVAVPADVQAYLDDNQDPSSLSADELNRRIGLGLSFFKGAPLSASLQRQVQIKIKSYRVALQSQEAVGGQNANGSMDTSTSKAPAQTATAPANNAATVDAAAEAKAQAILSDPASAQSLGNPQLRDRLDRIRLLLANSTLSPATEKALRQKLRAERTILRSRIDQQASTGGTTAGGTGSTAPSGGSGAGAAAPTGGGNTTINNTTIKFVLADRRPAEQLPENELRLRIDVYRDAVLDTRYSQPDRDFWRLQMEQDRRMLRQRLIEARQERARSLENNNINIQLGMRYQPGRQAPRDVFAAEVDDQQLEDTLVAPPLRAINRRYTLNEVENSPDLRDAIPRIEIDTIHFGFGESFVREEEIDNLDRIAEIMEKILATHPREVFLIEGHTDAVGSDESNLKLSRLRAEAIKSALVTFYVIPPENLETVGYGERYLKIPTLDAEPENRRVSVARVTPLVGELPE